MKKEFKGQPCVYCGKPVAETVDHIVSREFFLKNQRDNLPQAPACFECNNEKAKLEHYLTAVLPFGGRHEDALENLSALVPRRLEKNAKLQRELKAGYDESGGTAIPIDHIRIEKLFAMIAQGLAWHHWKVRLGDGYAALGSIFADAGETFFSPAMAAWNTPHRVAENLGNGTFRYEGAQATDCPQATIWRFWMYNGIRFGGDPLVQGPSSLAIAVTGTSARIESLRGIADARETYREVARTAKPVTARKIGRNESCPCGSGQKYKKCCGAVVPKVKQPA